MDKNLLQEEFEQAEKRGGAEYAKAYTEGLNDGCQQALQQCHVMRWVAVDDKLPAVNEPVLVVDKWGYMSVCGYGGQSWYPKLDGSYPNFDSNSIAHWAELPPPPIA